jgi:Tol biopolymer transport system component
MAERWRTELRRIDRLGPADDLIERASARPLTPLPELRTPSKFVVIALALLVPVAFALAGFAVLRDRSTKGSAGTVAPAPIDPENGDLLYAKYDGDVGWHLFSVDPHTGKERLLTHGTRDYGSDWSPDGTKIVYDSESGSGFDLVVADADGSDPVAIGQGQDPTWSPDGNRIAYAGDGGSIWVMNADGSDAHPVTAGAAAGPATEEEPSNAAYDWNPAWSPDGRSIAYSRVVAHRGAPLPNGKGQKTDVTLEELRVWHDGVQPADTMLTDAYTHIGELDWSPDGTTIVFTGAPTLFAEETTNGLAWPRVLLIPSTGGTVTAISPDEKTWAAGATWSPDGEWIAYVRDNHSLTVMRPDGSDAREIPIDPGADEIIGPSWGVASGSSR